MNSLADVERVMPGFLTATREWFRIYKIPDGKPENKFAFDGEYQDAEFANKVISETHEYWKQLVGETKYSWSLKCVCFTIRSRRSRCSYYCPKQQSSSQFSTHNLFVNLSRPGRACC